MEMKKYFVRLLLAGVLTANYFLVLSQDTKSVQYDGFYLGMNLGPVWGNCNGVDNTNARISVTGTGFNLGFLIGTALETNLIAHASFFVNSISGPKFNDVKVDNKIAFDETFLGAGMTQFFSPSNTFISGNIGFGKFTITDNSEGNSNYAVSTEGGFGFQLKAGKEWVISEKWGIGVMAFYSGTYLKSTPTPNIEERWDSSRYGISFNASFH